MHHYVDQGLVSYTLSLQVNIHIHFSYNSVKKSQCFTKEVLITVIKQHYYCLTRVVSFPYCIDLTGYIHRVYWQENLERLAWSDSQTLLTRPVTFPDSIDKTGYIPRLYWQESMGKLARSVPRLHWQGSWPGLFPDSNDKKVWECNRSCQYSLGIRPG